MVIEVEVLAVRSAVAALAGLGDRVQVLDPPEVVEAMRDTLAAAASRYSSGPEQPSPSDVVPDTGLTRRRAAPGTSASARPR
jgi:hypothetical protein